MVFLSTGGPPGATAVTRGVRLLRELIRNAKLRLLRMHFEARVGHIGGNLSALEMLMTLYHRVLAPDDLFVLSKGHSAGALYTTLWSVGKLREDDLVQFHQEGTSLSGHPPATGIPDVIFATGSLGHGLGLAAGLALGKRLKGAPGRVFCLLSDGEWNEGSTWESLIFAAHQRLDSLTLMIDLNGLQGFGSTREVADLGSLQEKLESFGLDVEGVDGHDALSLERALLQPPTGGRPRALVARSIKGHGVSFMERKMEWHYHPMAAEQYAKAVREVTES